MAEMRREKTRKQYAVYETLLHAQIPRLPSSQQPTFELLQDRIFQLRIAGGSIFSYCSPVQVLVIMRIAYSISPQNSCGLSLYVHITPLVSNYCRSVSLRRGEIVAAAISRRRLLDVGLGA